MGTTSTPLVAFIGFTEPDLEAYEQIFADDEASISRGGGFEDIKFFVPERRRRAGGFFSYFTKNVIPWIKPIAFKLISNVMGDLSEGNLKVKDVLKRRGLESIGDIAQKATRGGARTKKRKTKSAGRSRSRTVRKKKMKKRNKEDIFSSIR